MSLFIRVIGNAITPYRTNIDNQLPPGDQALLQGDTSTPELINGVSVTSIFKNLERYYELEQRALNSKSSLTRSEKTALKVFGKFKKKYQVPTYAEWQKSRQSQQIGISPEQDSLSLSSATALAKTEPTPSDPLPVSTSAKPILPAAETALLSSQPSSRDGHPPKGIFAQGTSSPFHTEKKPLPPHPKEETMEGVSLSQLLAKLPRYFAATQKAPGSLSKDEKKDLRVLKAFQEHYDIPTPEEWIISQSAIPSDSEQVGGLSPSKTEESKLEEPMDASLGQSAALCRELTMQELYGQGPLRGVTINQHGNNSCYLLSTLDSILHLPQEKAQALLSRIKMHKSRDTYQVTFPGQREPILVTEKELNEGNGADSSALGIRLIEKAYLKIPGVRAGLYDESANALQSIFGEAGLAPITIQNSRTISGRVLEDGHEVVDWRGDDGRMGKRRIMLQPEHWIGDFGFLHEERHKQFRQLIETARNQPESDVLTAIRIGAKRNVSVEHKGQSFQYQAPTGGHYYSVRLHESTPEQIVLADPFDTSKTVKVPFDAFMREFNLEGMRIN